MIRNTISSQNVKNWLQTHCIKIIIYYLFLVWISVFIYILLMTWFDLLQLSVRNSNFTHSKTAISKISSVSIFFQIKKELDLNNSQQKKYYQYFRVTPFYKIQMSYFDEIDGEASYQQAVELNQAAFAEVDFHLYPPLRTHFLIHAIQSRQKLPSEKSMLRSERKNQRRAVVSVKQAVIGSRRPAAIMCMQRRMPFVVPQKKGAIVAKRIIRKRRRNRGRVNLSMFPFNAPQFRPIIGSPPIGFPPMIPMGMIPGGLPIMGSSNLASMSPPTIGMIPSIPPMMHSVPPMGPLGFPSMVSIPQLPPGLGLPMMPPGLGRLPMMPPGMPVFGVPPNFGVAPLMTKKKQKQPKKANTAFKVRSPEQILLKSKRDACRAKVEEWRKESKPNLAENVLEETPTYFKKKKASQKRRRLEKHELIKKNVKALYEIYGEAIYNTGWPVSRREIMQALGIKEENEVELEGVSELMSEQKQELEKIEENTHSQGQLEIVADRSEKKEKSDEREVKLVLIKENTNAASVCLIPQFVYTG